MINLSWSRASHSFDIDAHGDGFTVSTEELLEFVVRAANILGFPSLSCCQCSTIPAWIVITEKKNYILCHDHKEGMLDWCVENFIVVKKVSKIADESTFASEIT